MKKYILIAFLSFSFFLNAQHQDVFPNESGDALIQHLVEAFKPETVLSYGDARNKMYGSVDNKNGKITCVYTGWEINVDPNGDEPKTEAFNNGINTEHTFPQSKGATGNAKSDAHHLFPTRVDVNGDRGHLPFDDIVDSQTDDWFRLDYFGHSIPSTDIDEYSELKTNNYFEPREDHKGNVARAMMYFYTMYKNQADNADNGYFQGMVPTLCDWHFQDAVDQSEWDRTWGIADFQDDKANPFVLDCSLATRTYCSDSENHCTVANEDLSNIQLFGIAPNPTQDLTTIRFTLDASAANGTISIYDAIGQLKEIKNLDMLGQGANEIALDLSGFGNGFYSFLLEIDGEVKAGRILVLD